MKEEAADRVTPVQQNCLSERATRWIEQVTESKVKSSRRVILAEGGAIIRRKSYVVDVESVKGEDQRYFVRADEDPESERGLKRESLLIDYLNNNTSIPTQKIHDFSDELGMVIQSFEPGRPDLHQMSRDQKHEVMLDFMRVLAEMHSIDLDDLKLIPGFKIPPTAEEHSLAEVRALDAPINARFGETRSSLLGRFGKRFLKNHAPCNVERTSLVQGDTGAGNFLFEGDKVTAVVDWEWGHLGDPMEDLGNIYVRDFFFPASGGDLTPYFKHYEKLSGLKVDYSKVRYYSVHQWVRSVLTMPRLLLEPDWKSNYALTLGYQGVVDVGCCNGIGLFLGINSIKPDPLSGEDMALQSDVPYDAIAEQIEKGVLPSLQGDFEYSIAEGSVQVIQYLKRASRYKIEADSKELDGINNLLGNRYAKLIQARADLAQEIERLSVDREPDVLRHLWSVALREYQIMQPLVERWSYCQLARLDD